jgi:predicted nuclease with TOPRIM domain
MRDEPESVDKNAQRRITKQADTVYLATHADEHRRKEARSIAAQTKEAVSRAWRQGIDIDENLERIRSEVNAILRKSGRDAA